MQFGIRLYMGRRLNAPPFCGNKSLCRNRACTNFYMAINVHRADRRDDIDYNVEEKGLLDFEYIVSCNQLREIISLGDQRNEVKHFGDEKKSQCAESIT